MSATAFRVAGVLALILIAEPFLYGFSYPYFSLALDERAHSRCGSLASTHSLAGAGILLVGPSCRG